MSSDDLERRFQHHVEFMIEQQSRFDERLGRLEEAQARQAENITRLVDSVAGLSEAVAATQSHLDTVIDEMREGFNGLIVSNEVTRKLAEDVARLEVQTAQRVTAVERRVDDFESKH